MQVQIIYPKVIYFLILKLIIWLKYTFIFVAFVQLGPHSVLVFN